jgi:hypothetical protein
MLVVKLQVGACIVSQDNIILSIGYNGFPRGCHDSKLPWAKKSPTGDLLATKYPYVCHAEMNAVLNKNTASLIGAVRLLFSAVGLRQSKFLFYRNKLQLAITQEALMSFTRRPARMGRCLHMQGMLLRLCLPKV